MEGFSKILIVVFCIFQAISSWSQEHTAVIQIDKKEMLAEVMGAEVQLIDVRTPEEYREGHIENALNFNVKDSLAFHRQIKTLNKKQPVYLYCRKGNRSNKASKILENNGFEIIYDYSGGYIDWKITH